MCSRNHTAQAATVLTADRMLDRCSGNELGLAYEHAVHMHLHRTSIVFTPHARTTRPLLLMSATPSAVSALARGHSISNPQAAAVSSSSLLTS